MKHELRISAARSLTLIFQLKDQFGPKLDVPPERRFLGFDAYRKAIDCLRPGDIAIHRVHVPSVLPRGREAGQG